MTLHNPIGPSDLNSKIDEFSGATASHKFELLADGKLQGGV